MFEQGGNYDLSDLNYVLDAQHQHMGNVLPMYSELAANGQVELTTLTQELLLPRHLEREEAIRLPPCSRFPFDGVGDVRPLGAGQGQGAVEGVY